MNNDYLLTVDEIEMRRANENDNMEELAKLIYYTDPYIYPFWFDNNEFEAVRVLKELIKEPGFIYYYKNMYIAYDKTINQIVGLVNAIDYTTNLDYDYSKLMQVNSNYKFVVEHYINEIIELVKNEQTMYIVNCCVSKELRGKRIGTVLLGNFIKHMEKAGFAKIEFDCLLHNVRAKNLYHSLGFKEMYTGIGFNGTENPSYPEIVYFKRFSGETILEEFKFSDNYPIHPNQEH